MKGECRSHTLTLLSSLTWHLGELWTLPDVGLHRSFPDKGHWVIDL